MDIERSGSNHPSASNDDPTLSRTIIPAAPRTTIIGRMSSRRRWSIQEKRAIVEASYDVGSTVQEVAHCFEVSPAQIYSWRRQVADGTIDRMPVKTRMPSFARVELAEPIEGGLSGSAGNGAMEIRLADGTAIIVGADVSEEALVRVLAALGR